MSTMNSATNSTDSVSRTNVRSYPRKKLSGALSAGTQAVNHGATTRADFRGRTDDPARAPALTAAIERVDRACAGLHPHVPGSRNGRTLFSMSDDEKRATAALRELRRERRLLVRMLKPGAHSPAPERERTTAKQISGTRRQARGQAKGIRNSAQAIKDSGVLSEPAEYPSPDPDGSPRPNGRRIEARAELRADRDKLTRAARRVQSSAVRAKGIGSVRESERALKDAGDIRALRDQIDGLLTRRGRPRAWTEDRILDALLTYRAEVGSWPGKADLSGRADLPSYDTLYHQFGGLPGAIERAHERKYEAEAAA